MRVSRPAPATSTRWYSAAIWFSTMRGTSCTMIAEGGAWFTWRRVSSRTRGCTTALSRSRAEGSAKAISASRPRSSTPAGVRISAPNSSRSRARPGVPGSTTARAMASASIRWAPSSANMVAIVDLPEPMPPVSPMCSMRPVLPSSVLAAGHHVQVLRPLHDDGQGAAQCLGTGGRWNRPEVGHVHQPRVPATGARPLGEVEEHAGAHAGAGAFAEGFESGDQCSRTHAGDSTGLPGARLTAANIQMWWVSLGNAHHFWMFDDGGWGAGEGAWGGRVGAGRVTAGEGRAGRPPNAQRPAAPDGATGR